MNLFPLGGFEVTYPTGTPPSHTGTLELLPVDVSYRMHSTREGTGTPRPGYLCPDLNLANSGTIPDWPPLGTPCLEQNDAFWRFRVFDCICSKIGSTSRTKCSIFFRKSSSFQKTFFLVVDFVSLVKLVTFLRVWDAYSRISRVHKNIPQILKIINFHWIWTLLVVVPIWKSSEDPSDFGIFPKFT